MIKVCKFGGTSMADAKAIKQVKDIIFADKDRKFIVVSAPGKRDKFKSLQIPLNLSLIIAKLFAQLPVFTTSS